MGVLYYLAGYPFLVSSLRLKDDALQFFKNWELLIRRVNLRIPLSFADQKANFFEALKFTLNITSIFLDKFCETANMRLKIRIFRINYDDFTAYSGGYKNI
jgi:hypothetical protein